MLRVCFSTWLMVVVQSAIPAVAQDTFFRVLPGGQFNSATAWAPFNPPFTEGPGGVGDHVNFGLSFVPGNRYTIENVFGDNNQLIVENDALTMEIIGYELHGTGFNNDASITVGLDANDEGDLLLRADPGLPNAQLQAVNVYLGSGEDSSGTITIDDADLSWNNSGFILAGVSGEGTLNVMGGAVVCADATIAGVFPASFGTVFIEGTGSRLVNELGFGAGIDLLGSQGGTGSVFVLSGGAIETGTDVIVGDGPTGAGSMTVSGSGSNLGVGEDLVIGTDGIGILNLQNGGTADVGAELFLGRDEIGSGTVTINGSESTLEAECVAVGCAGTGDLTLLNGGTLRVSNSVDIGDSETGIGILTIDGIGSVLDSVGLLLGCGEGELSVQNGGTASADDIRIGIFDSGIGTATIDGSNSTLNAAVRLHVGSCGIGEMLVQNGGTVFCDTNCHIGVAQFGLLTIHGNGSTLNVDDLTVGGYLPAEFWCAFDNGTGDLVVQNGGNVFCTNHLLARTPGSTGTVNVQDSGSLISVTGSLAIGGDLDTGESGGIAEFNIDTGGSVSVGGDIILFSDATFNFSGRELTANSIMFVGAGGQFNWTNGHLHVGSYAGDLVNEGGTLAPGDSVGSTVILGDYSQDENSTLQIDIGGTIPGAEHDFVNVNEDFFLDGELELRLTNGFIPDDSQSFTVAGSGNGNLFGFFANVGDGGRLDTDDGAGSFLVRYGLTSPNPDQIVLNDFQPTGGILYGDVNLDGEVNLLDVAPFVELLTGGMYQAEADINMDGEVNLLDVGPFVALLTG